MQMTWSELRAMALRRLVPSVLATASMAAGCTPTPQPQAGDPGMAVQPAGRLVEPVGTYLGANARLQNLVDPLFFGGGNPGTPPGGGPQQPELYIEAMSEANRFRADSATAGPYGTIVARIRRIGPGQDAVYGTKNGPNFDYYVVVSPSPKPDSSSFFVLELTKGASPRVDSARVGGLAVTGMFKACPERHRQHDRSSANFKGCEQDNQPGGTSSRIRSFFSVPIAWAQGFGNGWLSCEFGCCELTAAPALAPQ